MTTPVSFLDLLPPGPRVDLLERLRAESQNEALKAVAGKRWDEAEAALARARQADELLAELVG